MRDQTAIDMAVVSQGSKEIHRNPEGRAKNQAQQNCPGGNSRKMAE
jgi:hypothetical protein